jgi:hypothetical protein
MSRRITRGVLAETEPSDSVDIGVRDLGVALDGENIYVTVDGGNVGLLRLAVPPHLAQEICTRVVGLRLVK